MLCAVEVVVTDTTDLDMAVVDLVASARGGMCCTAAPANALASAERLRLPPAAVTLTSESTTESLVDGPPTSLNAVSTRDALSPALASKAS